MNEGLRSITASFVLWCPFSLIQHLNTYVTPHVVTYEPNLVCDFYWDLFMWAAQNCSWMLFGAKEADFQRNHDKKVAIPNVIFSIGSPFNQKKKSYIIYKLLDLYDQHKIQRYWVQYQWKLKKQPPIIKVVFFNLYIVYVKWECLQTVLSERGYTDRQVVRYLGGKRRDDSWLCASNVINTVSNTALKVMDAHSRTIFLTFELIFQLRKKSTASIYAFL